VSFLVVFIEIVVTLFYFVLLLFYMTVLMMNRFKVLELFIWKKRKGEGEGWFWLVSSCLWSCGQSEERKKRRLNL